MHITHTDFTHRQWDYYERHCVQCTIRWHSQVSVIKFCCGNTGSFNSGSAHFAPFQNSISRSCFPPWVFVLHDETYTASSCLTQLYVEFLAHFWAESWLLQDRLKVRPTFAQFLERFWEHFLRPRQKILKFCRQVAFVDRRVVCKLERPVSNPGGATRGQTWLVFIHFFIEKWRFLNPPR